MPITCYKWFHKCQPSCLYYKPIFILFG